VRICVYVHIRTIVFLTGGKLTMFKLCNYGKGVVSFLELFYCLWSLFCCWWILVELLGLRVFILLFMLYFLFMNRIGMSVILWYWSLVDMNEGCCWCDLSSVGTLTYINSLEYVCWAHFTTDYTYAIYIGNLFFWWGSIGLHVSWHHIIMLHTKINFENR
jgi:hypothetical protein